MKKRQATNSTFANDGIFCFEGSSVFTARLIIRTNICGEKPETLKCANICGN